MAKSVLPNNGLALCIIIIIVVGLFLHYELGYNLDLFSVGGKRSGKRSGRNKYGHGHPRHKPLYHPHSWFTHNIYTTHTHPQNITLKKDDLFNQYDLNNDNNIDKGEFSQALDNDLKNKMNDKNTYSFY
jgi:hypothetical protein